MKKLFAYLLAIAPVLVFSQFKPGDKFCSMPSITSSNIVFGAGDTMYYIDYMCVGIIRDTGTYKLIDSTLLFDQTFYHGGGDFTLTEPRHTNDDTVTVTVKVLAKETGLPIKDAMVFPHYTGKPLLIPLREPLSIKEEFVLTDQRGMVDVRIPKGDVYAGIAVEYYYSRVYARITVNECETLNVVLLTNPPSEHYVTKYKVIGPLTAPEALIDEFNIDYKPCPYFKKGEVDGRGRVH